MLKLSSLQVNSWRLSEHHLADRVPKPNLSKVVSDVCGIQAQWMSSAEIAIWARVKGIKAADVRAAVWKDHSLVKTWCMRGTLHLLAASDLPLYVAALKSRQEFRDNPWLRDYQLTEADLERIVVEIRIALDNKLLTREALAREISRRLALKPKAKQLLLSGWGVLFQPAAFQGSLCFGPNEGRNVTFARPDKWVKEWKEPNAEEAFKMLFRRFARAYGPIRIKDFEHWWGRSGLPGESAMGIMTSIEDELEEVEFEGETALMRHEDVKGVERLAETPSVRLLPSWDCYVMFYSPRERLVAKNYRTRIFRQLQGNAPVLLINGVAAGVWQLRRRSRQIEVKVEPFSPLSTAQRHLVQEEASNLGDFYEIDSKLSITQQ